MLTLKGLKQAERFVKNQRAAGNDVRWEGFSDIVFFRPSPRGEFSKDGAFRNGEWGFDNRVTVDSNGVWEVDYRNVRRTQRTRN